MYCNHTHSYNDKYCVIHLLGNIELCCWSLDNNDWVLVVTVEYKRNNIATTNTKLALYISYCNNYYYASVVTVHIRKYSHCGSCVILITLAVVCFTDETLDVWCSVVYLLNCWLSVVLIVLIWIVVNSVVMVSTGKELNASKISANRYKT